MDASEIVKIIFEVLIFPLLSMLSIYLTNYIKLQAEKIQDKYDNELVDKYVDMLNNIISTAVRSTNQIYVDYLKANEKFDLDSQKAAFTITYDSVKKMLTADAMKLLSSAIGDLDIYIKNRIEAEVNNQKEG